MEQKLVKVPFEVELAKKITKGEEEGRIVTRKGRNARIICWDAHCDDNIVALIEDENGVEFTKNYVSDGMVFLTGESDCDLMLEVPEVLTFKDGDIYKTEIGSIAIYNGNYQAIINNTPYYVGLRISDNKLIFQSDNYGFGIIEKCSLDVSEEEKQKLIDALKASKEPKAKEYLKRFFGLEEKPECEFKPFDKVLVKDDDENSAWSCNLFSGKNEDGTYMCIGGYWDMCIPYNDQTKHLLGTTDNWEG